MKWCVTLHDHVHAKLAWTLKVKSTFAIDSLKQASRIRIAAGRSKNTTPGAQQHSPKRCRVEVWRIFRHYGADLPPRFVYLDHRRLCFHRPRRPAASNSGRRIWEKDIVCVEKDQDGMARK